VLESLWDEDHFKRDFDPPRALPPATRLRGTHASLISLWGNNYFHWIFNCLPRLAVLEASGVQYDGLIVPERLAPFQRAHLEILGIPEHKLVPFTGAHVQADTLVWAAPMSPINEPSSYLLDWVRAALCPEHPEPHRRLYVSRRDSREAVNEKELYAELEPLGYEFLLPETLPFREQVKIFASTRLAVGPHGSNFVNGIFSRQLAVLELFQPAHVNWGVYSVLCAAGQDHWNIICPPVKRRGPRRFDDMKVPIDLVLETIEVMEKEIAA
jgi:capsular polysaccharide biosynthesis protein